MGCCCGHPDRGGPKTLPGTLKPQMRRAFREARLDGLRPAFTGTVTLPSALARRAFAWTGGGPGPVPPVEP